MPSSARQDTAQRAPLALSFFIFVCVCFVRLEESRPPNVHRIQTQCRAEPRACERDGGHDGGPIHGPIAPPMQNRWTTNYNLNENSQSRIVSIVSVGFFVFIMSAWRPVAADRDSVWHIEEPGPWTKPRACRQPSDSLDRGPPVDLEMY